ncbi:hypothetical protein AB0E98_31305, partial [Streptomyces sp. NPDC037389]
MDEHRRRTTAQLTSRHQQSTPKELKKRKSAPRRILGGERFSNPRSGLEKLKQPQQTGANSALAEFRYGVLREAQNISPPVLRQVYDQMPNPKWVISMG